MNDAPIVAADPNSPPEPAAEVFGQVTAIWVNGATLDLVHHVGGPISVSVDGHTPQMTWLAAYLHDETRGGGTLTLAQPITVPRFPLPTTFAVFDEHWRRITPNLEQDTADEGKAIGA